MILAFMTSSSSEGGKLHRGSVGFPTALATAVGLIIAGPVLLTATTGFGLNGASFAIAVVIAFVLMMAQATSFSEAAAMLPTAGSVYDYISAGLGRFPAIVGTLSGYLVVHIFAGTAEVAIAGAFAAVNFESLAPLQETGSWRIGVALVVLFAAVNALGIELYGWLEIAMTAFMWFTLVVFGVMGALAPAVVPDAFASSAALDVGSTSTLVGFALFLFVGCEFVTPLAAELREPARTIPRAMYLGITAVCIAMLVYGVAVVRQVPNVLVDADGSTRILETPMAIPVFAETVLGRLGRLWLGAAVLLASSATINTLLAGVPRILYGMAREGSLPSMFAYVHPRFGTPVVAIAVVAAIPAVYAFVIDGNVERIVHLILASVCAWILAYLLVNASIVSLRLRRPGLERPYRVPWFPLPQIAASLGMLVAMWYIAPPGMSRGDIYVPFAVVLAGASAYALLWTRLAHREPLFEPVEPATILGAERES